ncbi:MAG: hypothetical protein V1858_04855 [Candidatus Gottesmanbacteria bacterium]
MEMKMEVDSNSLSASDKLNITTPTSSSLNNSKKNSKFKIILVILLIIFVFLSTVLCLYKFGFGLLTPKILKERDTTVLVKPPVKPQAFSARVVNNRDSSNIVFIRGGDVWTSSVEGNNQTKITTHTPIQYTSRHYLTGNNVDAKWDEDFFTQPRISGDGRIIAYLEISKDAINKLLKWKEDVKNEPMEVKNSGDSIAFNPPGISYDLKIYDLVNNREISIADKLVNKSVDSQSYDLYNWARDKNVLAFDWNSKIHFLVEDISGNFSIISFDKEFTPDPISEEWSGGEWNIPSGVTISPDGNKAIAYYQFTTPARGCFNTWGYKSYLLEFPNKKLTKLPLDISVTCQSYNVGWISDNQFYVLETRPNYDFKFSLWSSDNILKQEILGYKGIVSNASVSPNGMWLSYLIKNSETNVSEYVFLKPKTTSGINLLGIMQEENNKKLSYGTVFTAMWNRSSQVAYVRMTRNSQDINDLIRFDPNSQEHSVILEDVSEYDVN